MKVIKCSSKHITEVSSLFCRAFSDSIDFFALENPSVGNMIEDFFRLLYSSYSRRFFVAVDDGGLVQGYIVVTDDIRRLWKDAFVFGFVLKALSGIFKFKGRQAIKLEVRPQNAAAIRIYSEYGFVEKGRTRDLQGEWIVMQVDKL